MQHRARSVSEGLRPRIELRRIALTVTTVVLLVAVGSRPSAARRTGSTDDPAAGAPTAPHHEIPRASTAIDVDGRLDEGAWEAAVTISLDYEVQPGENVTPPVETECRLTYDTSHLYFGCLAHDPDPAAIRARFTDRDEAFRDDFLGIIVDTFDDERQGFEFFVNPVGVQMDLTRSDTASGNVEDPSWDAIWDSAGRITADGYVVEAAIPFHQLRFQRTGGERAEQTWGIFVIRSYPRSLRHQISNVPFDRGRNCFLCQSAEITGFAGVEPGRSVEIDPTVTALRTDTRDDPTSTRLATGDIDTEAGVTAIWGMTPNLTLSGTVNPDFSQVEADVAQLEVNERFTLFFPEKRPFFVEGAELFDTQLQAVHTRNIADPIWGAKLAGKTGRNVVGLIAARDELTTLLIPASQSSAVTSLTEETVDAVLRYRRDVGASSTVGLLSTIREGETYSNRVVGVDGLLRFTDSDSISYQLLGSRTDYPAAVAEAFDQPADAFDDEAWRLAYTHSTRDWNWSAEHLDIGSGFRADLGFVPQVDLQRTELGADRTWWGDDEDWYTRLDAGLEWRLTEEQDGDLLERQLELILAAQGPWQSFVRLETDLVDERFGGVEFEDQLRSTLVAQAQPTGDLEATLVASSGDVIDFANVRAADRLLLAPEVAYRAGRHLELSLAHSRERLDVDGGRLFTADLSELRSVYQFDVRTFVRAIVQYRTIERDPSLYTFAVEPESEELFGQLLFSYTLNPQTVFFLGYTDEQVGTGTVDLTRTGRTFFAKIGYAWVP